MMRRTPLSRGTKPLRRTTRLRARGDTKYRRRARDLPFMRWVKRQTCFVRVLSPFSLVAELRPVVMPTKAIETPCSGPIEADHMGERGMGQKAADDTCVPMCRGHHRERHDHAGTFRPLKKPELRAWRARAIEHTQAAWSAR